MYWIGERADLPASEVSPPQSLVSDIMFEFGAPSNSSQCVKNSTGNWTEIVELISGMARERRDMTSSMRGKGLGKRGTVGRWVLYVCVGVGLLLCVPLCLTWSECVCDVDRTEANEPVSHTVLLGMFV